MNRICVLLLLLCCWTLPAHALGLVASVDRDQLDSGETVELTLESSDATLFGKPDLTPLDTLFEVRGTRQVNQLTNLSDDNKATTRWIITLQPKQYGTGGEVNRLGQMAIGIGLELRCLQTGLPATPIFRSSAATPSASASAASN